MFKACMKCGKVGFWFQFFTSFEGIYTWAPNYCKECADKLTRDAVSEDIERIESNNKK